MYFTPGRPLVPDNQRTALAHVLRRTLVAGSDGGSLPAGVYLSFDVPVATHRVGGWGVWE